ncbi:MAG: hypothetical protein ACM34J_07125 [Ignavibacteria bacterium]
MDKINKEDILAAIREAVDFSNKHNIKSIDIMIGELSKYQTRWNFLIGGICGYLNIDICPTCGEIEAECTCITEIETTADISDEDKEIFEGYEEMEWKKDNEYERFDPYNDAGVSYKDFI